MKFCKSNYCLLLPFFVLILVFQYFTFTGQDGWDAIRYAENAANLVQGESLLNHHFAFRTVPVLLTALSYSLFGISDFSTALFPMLTTFASLFLIIHLLVKQPKLVTITALVIYSFTLINLIYFNKLLPDLYVSFFYLLIYKFLRDIYFHKTQNTLSFVGLAISVFFVFLTKGTVIFLLPLFGVLFFTDIFKYHRNLKQWMFFGLIMLMLVVIYLILSKIIAGDYFARFRAIEENSYLNRCSSDPQPIIFLLKRLFYEWFVAGINTTVLFPLIFLVPLWIKKKYWQLIYSNEPYFFAFLASILLLSSNFMSISITSYIPLCPDPRHFLFLVPLFALSSSFFIVYYFSEELFITRNTKKNGIIILSLLIVFSIVAYFNAPESFYYFYLPMGIIVLIRMFVNRRFVLYLFWSVWLILPVKYVFYAQEVNFSLQKEWLFELKELPTPSVVVSNKVQKHYWRYYNGFEENPNVQFFNYNELDTLQNKSLIHSDSIYLWLNYYTRFLSNQTDKDLPLYVSDTANYRLIKSYPKRGMYLYKIPEKALEQRPFYVSVNNYEQYDSLWHVNSGNITAGVEKTGEYSATFLYPLKFVDEPENLKIHISNRLKALDSENIQLVISIDGEAGKNLYWKGIPLAKYIYSYNAWWNVSVFEAIQINPSYSNKTLKVYLWNPDKHSFWVDDWKIEIYR